MSVISIEVIGHERLADHTSYVVKVTTKGIEVRNLKNHRKYLLLYILIDVYLLAFDCYHHQSNQEF